MEEPKDKKELMILALQQRIGELTVMYESQIASLRADLTLLSRLEEITNGKASLGNGD